MFCVGENGKMWDFSRVLGFCFWLCCFLFCWLYGGWIFRLVNERRDFLFCVSEDANRRDFWGSILKACSEVVWGLRVGVERKFFIFYFFIFLMLLFLNVIYATFFKCNLHYFFLEGIIIYLMYHVNGYPI